MYTLEIPLNTKGYDDFLAKRFKYAYKLKRAVVNWMNTQEHRRVTSDAYQHLAERTKRAFELAEDIKNEKDKGKKAILKSLHKELSEELKKDWIALNNDYKLNGGKFINYKDLGQASIMYERYADQGIVNWATMELIAQTVKGAYLKRRKQGDSVNYVRVGRERDFTTLPFRKCNNNITENGVYFQKSKGRGRAHKVFIPFAFRRDQDIKLAYALGEQKMVMYYVKRVEIAPGKWKYSLLMVFDGVPYGLDHGFYETDEVVINLSVEKMAVLAMSNGEFLSFDLSNDFEYSERLANLDRKIEAKRRELNPDNYEYNGVAKKGPMKWEVDDHYLKLLDKKRHLWHKIKKSRKRRFGEIANQLLLLGDGFTIHMEDFNSLQARKDYDPESMGWYDKRKQAGFEIMFNAPYEFVEILENKLFFKDTKLNKIKAKKQSKED